MTYVVEAPLNPNKQTLINKQGTWCIVTWYLLYGGSDSDKLVTSGSMPWVTDTYAPFTTTKHRTSQQLESQEIVNMLYVAFHCFITGMTHFALGKKLRGVLQTSPMTCLFHCHCLHHISDVAFHSMDFHKDGAFEEFGRHI